MKRELIVSSLQQATEMIKAFLKANALPVPEKLDVMFGWLARDLEEDDEVGCPCFCCDCGPLKGSNIRTSNILVYVKIFANKNLNVTRLYPITGHRRMFFDMLDDGDIFEMKDAFHRYQDQKFVYKNGTISEVE